MLIIGIDEEHQICIYNGKEKTCFPMTEQGCKDLAGNLRDRGVFHWGYSSSIDFPKEYDPSFEGDLREMIEKEYDELCDKYENLNQKQIQAIKFAHADLIGAVESYNLKEYEHHDWLAHLDTIRDLEKAFAFLEPCNLEVLQD